MHPTASRISYIKLNLQYNSFIHRPTMSGLMMQRKESNLPRYRLRVSSLGYPTTDLGSTPGVGKASPPLGPIRPNGCVLTPNRVRNSNTIPSPRRSTHSLTVFLCPVSTLHLLASPKKVAQTSFSRQHASHSSKRICQGQ